MKKQIRRRKKPLDPHLCCCSHFRCIRKKYSCFSHFRSASGEEKKYSSTAATQLPPSEVVVRDTDELGFANPKPLQTCERETENNVRVFYDILDVRVAIRGGSNGGFSAPTKRVRRVRRSGSNECEEIVFWEIDLETDDLHGFVMGRRRCFDEICGVPANRSRDRQEFLTLSPSFLFLSHSLS